MLGRVVPAFLYFVHFFLGSFHNFYFMLKIVHEVFTLALPTLFILREKIQLEWVSGKIPGNQDAQRYCEKWREKNGENG